MRITEDYRRLQEELHQNARYGAASMKFAPMVRQLIRLNRPATLLDYGAGKRLLRTAIGGVEITEYDPGVPAIAALPHGKFDMVCCLDVLEHIEPECLEAVLTDLGEFTGNLAFLSIHTGPAGKFLSDGRNAHLIQQPIHWWEGRLEPHFARLEWQRVSKTTYAVTGWV